VWRIERLPQPGTNVDLLQDPSITDTFTGNAAVNNARVAVTSATGEEPQSAGRAGTGL
jgi:cyanophycinase-like exopeptidase